MKTLIQTKRDSLETFIREQMIGPNGCRGHFDLEEDNFDNCVDEVINTTPGTIYSTAILFPKEDNSSSAEEQESENPENTLESEDIADDPDKDEEETLTDLREKRGDDEYDVDDDACTANRRFPNMIGISCCLAPMVDWKGSVKIRVSGRYYTRIKGEQRKKVQVVIDAAHREKFDDFYHENREKLDRYFVYTNEDKKSRLNACTIDYEIEKEVKDLLKDLNKQYAKSIATMPNGTEDPCYTAIDTNYRRLSIYREALFKKLNSKEEQEMITEAKVLLMERNNMTEEEAHHYIQKRSMDNGTGLTETAQMILSLLLA